MARQIPRHVIRRAFKLLRTFNSQSPSQSPEEANSPSHNKEDDEGSEDDSDDRIDQSSYDPERLKAFNVISKVPTQSSRFNFYFSFPLDVCSNVC